MKEDFALKILADSTMLCYIVEVNIGLYMFPTPRRPSKLALSQILHHCPPKTLIVTTSLPYLTNEIENLLRKVEDLVVSQESFHL